MSIPNRTLKGEEKNIELRKAVEAGYSFNFEESVTIHINPSTQTISVFSNNPIDMLKRPDAQQQFVDQGMNVHEVNAVLNKVQEALSNNKGSGEVKEPMPSQKDQAK